MSWVPGEHRFGCGSPFSVGIEEELIELISPPCRTAGAAAEALTALREAVAGTGAAMIASGTHPDGRFGDAPLHDTPRYHAVEDALRGVLRTPRPRRHARSRDDDAGGQRERVHAPMINALAANSPFWHGVDSGLASARTISAGTPRPRRAVSISRGSLKPLPRVRTDDRYRLPRVCGFSDPSPGVPQPCRGF
jgi:hypothetical protein